jgi:hypothetical protein
VEAVIAESDKSIKSRVPVVASLRGMEMFDLPALSPSRVLSRDKAEGKRQKAEG